MTKKDFERLAQQLKEWCARRYGKRSAVVLLTEWDVNGNGEELSRIMCGDHVTNTLGYVSLLQDAPADAIAMVEAIKFDMGVVGCKDIEEYRDYLLNEINTNDNGSER